MISSGIRSTFHVEQFSTGFYFVRIISEDRIINRIFKIEKM